MMDVVRQIVYSDVMIKVTFFAVHVVNVVMVTCSLLFGGNDDQLKPVPDPLFQNGAASSGWSVFGDSFPAVGANEVLVQTHMYVACVNRQARQPAWVAYRVERADWDTEIALSRNFSTPRHLRDVCLEPSDFSKSGYELGHLYALQFVAARDRGYEVNYLCAVAAQRPDLNKGPWLDAEERIRQRSLNGSVAVVAGQLWQTKMPGLKNADEPHAVASHCWIMLTDDAGTESYLFPQGCRRDAELTEFSVEPATLRAMVAPRWIERPTEEHR